MLPAAVQAIDLQSTKPIPKQTNPLYLSRRWRSLVAEIIRERGARCEDPDCRCPTRTGIRLFGDHIVELADGGAPFDKQNVMIRCGSCHTRKTNAERAKRMARSR